MLRNRANALSNTPAEQSKIENQKSKILLGSHLSIAGGLQNALLEARRLGMNCVQVFTKNQRQWKCKPLSEEQIRDWDAHRREVGLDAEHTVSHDSYLINLASPKPETLDKSLALFREEIERCEALGVPHLVAHPGSHVGEGEDAGLQRIIDSIDAAHADLPGYRTLTCLENTAGQGTALGYDLDHLRRILDGVKQPERLAVCIDTAHALAGGYDLTSAAGARGFLDELDRTLGLQRVRAMHINDSKTPRGSRVDRHEHIGHGHVALDAFAVIVNEPRLRNVPKVLETPKKMTEDGREWDAVNLETLRGLVREIHRGERGVRRD